MTGCDITSSLGTNKQYLKPTSLNFAQKALLSLGNTDLSTQQLIELEKVC